MEQKMQDVDTKVDTHIANDSVTNGADGKDGKDGANGRDGTDGKDGQDGERGESGVYVGTDTPPDDADVWVDPNGSYSFKSETWKFTLEDETTVEKTVVLLG